MAEEDALEVFSSSLHSLFDHVVPANGDPLELFNYDPPKASRQPRLVCRIPPQQVNVRNNRCSHHAALHKKTHVAFAHSLSSPTMSGTLPSSSQTAYRTRNCPGSE